MFQLGYIRIYKYFKWAGMKIIQVLALQCTLYYMKIGIIELQFTTNNISVKVTSKSELTKFKQKFK